MSCPAQPRLPLLPLLKHTGLDQAVVLFHRNDTNSYRGEYLQERPAPQTLLAELVGQNRRTVNRWAVDGIPLPAAEDACDLLGVHPCNVWGDVWIEAVLSLDDDAADAERATREEERAEREWGWARLRAVLAEPAA